MVSGSSDRISHAQAAMLGRKEQSETNWKHPEHTHTYSYSVNIISIATQ